MPVFEKKCGKYAADKRLTHDNYVAIVAAIVAATAVAILNNFQVRGKIPNNSCSKNCGYTCGKRCR
jgi:ADP-ribosylglycohydrolase